METIDKKHRVQIGAKKLWTSDFFLYSKEKNIIYIVEPDYVQTKKDISELVSYPIVKLFSFYLETPGVHVLKYGTYDQVLGPSRKHIPVIKVTFEEYAVLREKRYSDRQVDTLTENGVPQQGYSYPYRDIEAKGRELRHEYGDGQRERMAKRIQQLLAEHGWTLGKLSRESGINYVSIAKYARGNYKFTTTVDHVWAIAKAFNVDMREFL